MNEKNEVSEDFTKRINHILQVVQSIASGNYPARAKLTSKLDTIDGLASGVNMLAEEIEAVITDRDKSEIVLKNKIEELERYKRLTVNRELKMIELKKRIKELEKGNKNE